MYFLDVFQGDRMWRFAAGLYLVYLAGGKLQLAAVFGFTAGGAIMLFGGIIGNWVDMNARLKGKSSGSCAYESERLLQIRLI